MTEQHPDGRERSRRPALRGRPAATSDQAAAPEGAAPGPTNRTDLSPPSLGAKLIEIGRHLDGTFHDMVTESAAFATSGEWREYASTAARWIADHLDVHVGTAREWIRVGSALAGLPAINAAFEAGELSYSKVRNLTRLATPDNEAELLPIAREVPAAALSRALADWSNRREEPATRDARHRRRRRFTTWIEPDGTIAGHLRLPPTDGGILRAAIDAAVARRAGRPRFAPGAPAGASDPLDRWPSLGQQRADALLDLVTGGGTGVGTEIVVHLRGDGATLDDGTPLTDTSVARLAPAAFFRALVHDAAGRPINASGRRRHPDARQKRVVKERDRTCVDCGSTDLLEFDHVPAFEDSGHTVVDELTLRCGPCHRRRHESAA